MCCFFCVHHSDWVLWVLCLISARHSMMLLLFLQCCWLLMRFIWKGMQFVCELFYLHYSDRVLRALCLFSMRHSMMSLLFLRFYYLLILMRLEKSRFMNAICVLFLLSSHPRLSSVSVAFEFNDSISDTIPVSSILLPVDCWEWKRVDCWWMPFVWNCSIALTC